LYVSFPDRQIGVIDAGKNPQDLVAIPYFVPTSDYAIGEYVWQTDRLYRAKSTVTASSFNPAQWDAVLDMNNVAGLIQSIDGAGSGFDADRLDGNDGLYYLDRINHTGSQAISTVSGLQLALDAKVNLTGGTMAGALALAGVSTAPTATPGTSTTQIASTAFVTAAVGAGTTPTNILGQLLTVDGAGSGLDADLLDGQTGSFYTTMSNMTGTVSAAQHGNLAGGSLHAAATSSTAGFMLDAPSDGVSYGRKNGTWATIIGGATIADTAPGAPLLPGQLWFDSDTGNTYIWYADADSQQWVQINILDSTSYPELDHIASASADMFAGFSTSGGNMFRINDKADGTGTNMFLVSEAGNVSGYSFLAGAGGIGSAGGLIVSAGNLTVNAGATIGNGLVVSAGSIVSTSACIAKSTGADGGLLYSQTSAGTNKSYLYWNNAGNRTEIGTLGSGNMLLNTSTDITFQAQGTAWTIGTNSYGMFSNTGLGAVARLKVIYVGAGNEYGFVAATGAATGTAFQFITNGSAQVGYIAVTASATTYSTSSDERLKTFTEVYDPAEAAAIIRADPVRHYTWNNDPDAGDQVGWGAQTSYGIDKRLAVPPTQEPPQAKPEGGDETALAPDEWDDPQKNPWGMDYGKRTPWLWAALTHALNRIDDLETRLAILEGGA
jgi:hypothetical protein